MKMVFASSNAHKVREVREILTGALGFEVELLGLKDIGFTGDIVEDGDSFEENSMIKARAVRDFCSLPTLADDSGLCVDALGGAPGIYSARYAASSHDSGNSSDEDNTALLLKNVRDKADRSAAYVCAVSFAGDGVSFTVTGDCRGRIIDDRRGGGGFGYDPVFYMDEFGATLAQVTEEQKNSVSHRGKAVRLAAKLLNALYAK